MTALPKPPRSLHLSFAALLVAAIWTLLLVGYILDIESFLWFLISTGSQLLATIAFFVWWFRRTSIPFRHRLLAFAAAIAFGILVGILCGSVIKPQVFLVSLGIPLVLAAWTLYLALAPRQPFPLPGLLLALALAWCPFFLIRINNLSGNMRPDLHFRFTPTGEELYLAHPDRPAATLPAAATALALRPGDWPGFRGPDRDSAARHLKINLDWKSAPPKVLWRERIGPAWSSMAIVDGRLFTQEQRGNQETVVCLDALTGREVWSHSDPARFDEATSGPGPRATPTFADGKLYTQGALGTLNCLDAATGKLLWSRNDGADSAAKTPLWGYSSSPLAAAGRVFVCTAGEGHAGLLAYSDTGGPPLWKADVGLMSYSSPQFAAPFEEERILIFTDGGLYALLPATGELRSHYPIPRTVGVPPVAQPCPVADNRFVLGHGAGFGAALVQFAPGTAPPTRQWITTQFKPSFSDMVLYQGYIYGFDGTVFCCVEAATGKRQWREGHYGAGQVILLADQGVMIVITETGQAILLRCSPAAHEELATLEAVSGKAWNHPAIAQNRLYVRSDAEMTCLELKRE